MTKTYQAPFMTGTRYEPGYLSGADGGGVRIAAGSVALDGEFRGNTVAGPRQLRAEGRIPASAMPHSSEFTLSLTSEVIVANASGVYAEVSPTPPQVILGNGSQAPADPSSSIPRNCRCRCGRTGGRPCFCRPICLPPRDSAG